MGRLSVGFEVGELDCAQSSMRLKLEGMDSEGRG